MNKTVTINLAGLLFHIDEDAFKKLQEYLTILKSAYANEQGSDEIISDIEARIAEIFQDKLSTKDQVVNTEMVEETITIMGKPEEIFATDEENTEEEKTEAGPVSNGKRKRRLYRDPDHRVLGGVSSGLASYFGIDVVVIRLLFATE